MIRICSSGHLTGYRKCACGAVKSVPLDRTPGQEASENLRQLRRATRGGGSAGPQLKSSAVSAPSLNYDPLTLGRRW